MIGLSDPGKFKMPKSTSEAKTKEEEKSPISKLENVAEVFKVPLPPKKYLSRKSPSIIEPNKKRQSKYLKKRNHPVADDADSPEHSHR